MPASFVKVKVIRPKVNYGLKESTEHFVEAKGLVLAKEMKKEYEKTVLYWKQEDRPFFAAYSQMNVGRRVLVISAGYYPEHEEASRIYSYIDWGTKGKTIVPKEAPLLVFKKKYKAHTTPGSLRSGRSGESLPWRKRKSVKWPGVRARGFTEMIQAKYKDKIGILQEGINESVNRFNASSGWTIR